MKIHHSKILDEDVVVIMLPSELAEGKRVALEKKCALYTKKEVDYLTNSVSNLNDEDRAAHIKLVNAVKKEFGAFICVPDNWDSKDGK